MVNADYRINNEFYIDAVPKFLQKLGKKSIIFDVDLYVGWGTPDALHDYERMEFMIKNKTKLHDMTEEEQRLLPLWSAYFNNMLTNFGLSIPKILTASPGTADVPGALIKLSLCPSGVVIEGCLEQ